MIQHGVILWISDRDQNGIIIDQDKNEYYFDISVTKQFQDLKRNDIVSFALNKSIKQVRCAKNVKHTSRP